MLAIFSTFSFCLGMLLMSFLGFPEWNPGIHERIIEKDMTNLIAYVGLMCIILPVSLLWYQTVANPDVS